MCSPQSSPSILRILQNYKALFSERDEYTVAFAVFAVDGLYYTLSPFNSDDPMWALTRQRGSSGRSVHFAVSDDGDAGEIVWVVGTLFLSDRAKRMWISSSRRTDRFPNAVTWVSKDMYRTKRRDRSDHTQGIFS